MFDDFRPSETSRESRARFRSSFAAALVIYGGSSAAFVGATATVRKIVEEKETQVEFAPPPEPPPPAPAPPPPPAAAPEAAARPRVRRPDLTAPTKLSDEKLKESSKPLASTGEGGPVDGFLDGAPGGTGTAAAVAPPPPPPPKAEPLIAPVEMSQNGRPRYPPSAKRRGIEGTVVVAFDVLEDGRVANPRVLSGPEELHDCVLRAVATWHFQPAHRGVEKVLFRMKKSIVFRLEDG